MKFRNNDPKVLRYSRVPDRKSKFLIFCLLDNPSYGCIVEYAE